MKTRTRNLFTGLALCMILAASTADAALAFTTVSKPTAIAGNATHDIGLLGSADWAVWTAVGAAAEQKASSDLIGDLVEVGTPGGLNANVSKFSWASGGDPTPSSTSFNASVISSADQENLDVGEGYAINIDLPNTTGSITFWGITRGNNQTNKLTIVDSGSTQVYDNSFKGGGNNWYETAYTMDWSGATPGETVTLNYLSNGGQNAGRVGVSGMAIDAATGPPSAIAAIIDRVEGINDYTLTGNVGLGSRSSGDQGLTAQAGSAFMSISENQNDTADITLTDGFAGQTVQAGTYTASISLGRSGGTLDRGGFDGFTLMLETTGGDEIGVPTVLDPYVEPGLVDAWDVLTVQYTVPLGSGLIGQDLTWSGLGTFDLVSGDQYGAFDNVVVEFKAIPEPSTGILAGLGLSGLFLRRRRR